MSPSTARCAVGASWLMREQLTPVGERQRQRNACGMEKASPSYREQVGECPGLLLS